MLLFAKLIALAALALAALEDLKTREVPDWLSFSLIFAGIFSSLIYSVSLHDYSYVLNSFYGLFAGMALGFAMYYTGQWGGGDSKLLMGIGALIGLDLSGGVPLLLTFMLNLFLLGALYGLLWSITLCVRHWKDFVQGFHDKLHDPGFIRVRQLNLGVTLLLFLGVLLTDFKLLFFIAMAFLYVTVYLWVFVKAIEDHCMTRKVGVDKLTEGDWVVEVVKKKGKLLYDPKELGVKKEHIEAFKKHKIKSLMVKEGVPFVPSFLLALIVTLLWENWFLAL